MVVEIIVFYFSKVGHHFQSSSDDEDDFKPISFLHTENSLQQVGNEDNKALAETLCSPSSWSYV